MLSASKAARLPWNRARSICSIDTPSGRFSAAMRFKRVAGLHHVRTPSSASMERQRGRPSQRTDAWAAQRIATARDPRAHLRRGDTWCSRPARAQIRRIKQEGVFADQPACRPVQLNKHVHEGLVDRAIAGDPHHRPPAPALNGHAQAIDRWCEIDTGLPECFGRGESRGHVLKFFRRGGNIHFRTKRLSESAENGDASETSSIGAERQGADGCCNQGAFEPAFHEVLGHEGLSSKSSC
jgi:hypothetical protein